MSPFIYFLVLSLSFYSFAPFLLPYYNLLKISCDYWSTSLVLLYFYNNVIHFKFFILKNYFKWCVINWVVDNFLQNLNKLIVLFHQLIDKCHIIWDNFLNKKFKMYNIIDTFIVWSRRLLYFVVIKGEPDKKSVITVLHHSRLLAHNHLG